MNKTIELKNMLIEFIKDNNDISDDKKIAVVCRDSENMAIIDYTNDFNIEVNMDKFLKNVDKSFLQPKYKDVFFRPMLRS